MIATMTVQSQHTDPLFSRNSNTAGAPLPGIPRRLSSGARPMSVPLTPPPSSSSKITVVVQQSTPPPSSQPTIATPAGLIANSESSSFLSVPQLTANQVCPPEQSTPTPAVHDARLEQQRQPLTTPESTPKSSNLASDASTSRRHSWIYTPGVSLRITTEQLKFRNFSESHAGTSSMSTPSRSSSSSSTSSASSSTEPRLIRKKSGQLVKSSLKPSKSLSVVTRSLGSKSEPNTPTHVKAVHFDAKLEHVKLFLAEQKPLAVSRDGSPTEDTSGTDTDFPSFIFGSDGDEERKNLVMHTPNMPLRPKSNADVVLESLKLGPDALNVTGKVRVRNITFSKWVVARFTFDEWQTTSEVTAAYSESLNAEFDVFVFNVRLNDLLARIEGKKMWLAVRFSVGDREMWDNNDSRNYLAEFSVGAHTSSTLRGGPSSIGKERSRGRSRSMRNINSALRDSSPATHERDSNIADLRSKLEKVVVQHPRPKLSPSHPGFSPRYVFPSSPPESWKSTFDSDHSHIHLRTRSYPMSTSTSTATPTPRTKPSIAPFNTPNSIPWPEKGKKISPPLGSPRDADEDVLFSAHRKSFEVEDAPFISASVSDSSSSSSSGSGGRSGFRNHRRGYFSGVHTLNHTSPGTTSSSSCESLDGDDDEESTPTMSRLYSLDSQRRSVNSAPPAFGLGFGAATLYGDESESSEQSTPSLSSSRDTSPSPTESMLYARDGAIGEEEVMLSPDTNYREFLSRFCFFTGSGTQGAQTHLLPTSPSPSPSPSPNSGSDTRHPYSAHARAHTHPHSSYKRQQPLDVPQVKQKQQTPASAFEFILGKASPASLHHHLQGLDEPNYVLAPATTVSLDDIASLSPRSGSATPHLLSPAMI